MNDKLNIIITGASSGIGFELTKALLEEGHFVYSISRSIDSLKKLKKENSYSKLTIIPFDLTKDDYSTLSDIFSNVTIDHLVNNAGFLVNKSIKEQTVEEFKQQYNVNVISVYQLVKTLLDSFNTSYSTICNITSMGGINGSAKFPGLSGYSSSKGALSVLTECLAEELKEFNIHVNALALGAVQTEMLATAFPGYNSDVSATSMASYIKHFILNDSKLFNGKIISVSKSTP